MKTKQYDSMLKISNRVLFIVAWQSRDPELMLTLQNRQKAWIEKYIVVSLIITAEFARKQEFLRHKK